MNMSVEYEYDVFISYSRDDNADDFIKNLSEELKLHKLKFWLDESNLYRHAGNNFNPIILNAIDKSQLFFLINSKNLSSYVYDVEIPHAISKDKSLMVYKKDDATVNIKDKYIDIGELQEVKDIQNRNREESIRIAIERKLGRLSSTKGVYVKLDSADGIYNRNDINMSLSSELFIWPIPDSRRKELESNGFTHHAIAKGFMYAELKRIIEKEYPQIIKCENIDEYIEGVAIETADDFIGGLSQDKTLFNGPMLGVHSINSSRTDGDEIHTLNIRLFKTDYFTFKLMTKLYQKLKNIKDIFDINTIQDANKLSPFLCSLGVGGFVIQKKGDMAMWIKRGKLCEASQLYHFSFDETVNYEKDRVSLGEIDAYNSLFRGLKEELGIYEHDLTGEGGIFEIGVILSDRIEIELLSYVVTSISNEDIRKKIDGAPDSKLELSECAIWDLDEYKIMLAEHYNTPESIALIDRIITRRDAGLLYASHIYPATVQVSPLAKIGKNVVVEDFTKICDGAKIGDNCKIHRNIFIDSDVQIGNNVKIQDNVTIPHGVTLCDGVFVGPSVSFTNDKFPRSVSENNELKSNKDWILSKTVVGHGASIGANATIVCGIKIGKWAMIGAGAVVVHDIPDYALVVGNPAKIIGSVDESGKK